MKKIFLCIKIEKMKEELKMKSDFYKEMKTKKRENVLKDTPEYEAYSENEVKLTIEEMRGLGLVSCGGCCSKNKGGCSKRKGCNTGCCIKS